MRLNLFFLAGLTLLLFSCTQTYIVTFSGSEGGSVSEIGGEYDEGTTVSVTATPTTGYEFQGWSDGSMQNPRTITVSESINLTALFSKQQLSLNVSILGGGSVVDSNGKTPSTYEFGSSVNLTPISNEGSYFVGWEIAFNPSEVTSSPEFAAYTTQLQSAVIKAQQMYAANSAGMEANLAVLSPSIIQSDEEFQEILTELDENYQDSNQNSITLPVFINLNITAVFEKRLYGLSVFSENVGGKISVNNLSFNQKYFFQPYQSTIIMTAEPAQGWDLLQWSGDVESNENPLEVNINKNLSISAEFSRKKFDLNVSIEGEGSVSEEVVIQPAQYEYETQVKLTATAEEYWEFIEWSGDTESTENPLTITIDSAKSLTAKFAKKDSDNDGVTDDVDQCPDTPEGIAVDENGCALDSDNDGVYDDIDLCLDTPAGAQVDENGCAASQKDTDNDGVTDDVDQCPDTPEGARVDVNGCTIPPIKVHSNGVTIIAEDWAEVGTEYTLNGKTYKIVDRAMLDDMITKGQDLSIAVTSKITNFGRLFYQKTLNNQEVRAWDTSNVTDMSNMLWQSNFNGDISLWDVRKVSNMYSIFFNSSFNGDVSKWKTESLTEMRFAFGNTAEFNSDLNDWDVSKVTDMSSVFANARAFNKPLDKWDVSNVTNMSKMFFNASSFNQDISNWCVRYIFAEPFQFYYNFETASDSFNTSYKPKWGTCPDGSSTDTGSGGDSTGDTSGNISFTRFSEAKACVNNVCDVTLGLRFSNGTSESITVSKIEVYTNGSLTTTYTAGDALGTYTAGQSKSFSISLDNATSGKVIVYYTSNGVSGTKEYDWTNQ